MENIELRSEKVRKAIGKKPSFFLTWGTTIITLILAALTYWWFNI
jgi:hypothetical protein